MAQRASKALLLLGQCMPSIKQNASKIRVRRMKLDTNLNMVRFCRKVFCLELMLTSDLCSISEKTRSTGCMILSSNANPATWC